MVVAPVQAIKILLQALYHHHRLLGHQLYFMATKEVMFSMAQAARITTAKIVQWSLNRCRRLLGQDTGDIATVLNNFSSRNTNITM